MSRRDRQPRDAAQHNSLDDLVKQLQSFRNKRAVVDDEFIHLYKILIAVLHSDPQKKKSHRDQQKNQYSTKEITHLSRRVIALGEHLQVLLRQDCSNSNKFSSEIARRLNMQKKCNKSLEENKEALQQELIRGKHQITQLAQQKVRLQKAVAEIESKLKTSKQGHSSLNKTTMEIRDNLNKIHNSSAEYNKVVVQQEKLKKEVNIQQSRLKELQRAHNPYSVERRQHLHDAEQQLLLTQKKIDTFQQELAQKQQALHNVRSAMDVLSDAARDLQIQGLQPFPPRIDRPLNRVTAAYNVPACSSDYLREKQAPKLKQRDPRRDATQRRSPNRWKN